ncbi:MAG: hypothetical protein WD030_07100 [Pirellulales bacterium]
MANFPHLLRILLAAGLLGFAAAEACAQRDRDDDGDRRRYDPAELLPRFDDNGDGVIQPDEVSGRARRYYERIISDAGLDPNQPIVIAHALEVFRRRDVRQQHEEWRDTLRNQSADALVPGFGETVDLPAVPGFGPLEGDLLPLEQLYTEGLLREVDELFERYDRDGDGRLDAEEQRRVRWSSDPSESDTNGDGVIDRRELAERLAVRRGDSARLSPAANTGRTGTAAGNASSGVTSDSDRTRRYAGSLLNQYDDNKNGVLDKEEVSKMSSNLQRADLNKDGTITSDELISHLNNFSGGESDDRDDGDRRRGYSCGGGGSGGGFYRPRRDDADPDRGGGGSYRFLAPAERLPKGTPSWFLRADADGDGQVSMHEYSATWSDAKAAEFAELDRNGDGRITPQEAIAGE